MDWYGEIGAISPSPSHTSSTPIPHAAMAARMRASSSFPDAEVAVEAEEAAPPLPPLPAPPPPRARSCVGMYARRCEGVDSANRDKSIPPLRARARRTSSLSYRRTFCAWKRTRMARVSFAASARCSAMFRSRSPSYGKGPDVEMAALAEEEAALPLLAAETCGCGNGWVGCQGAID